MPTRVVHVQIDAPEEVSAAARELAVQKGEEAAILSLWEAGEISSSRAAEELGLSAHAFLDLLTAKHLPVVRDFDPGGLQDTRKPTADSEAE